MRLKYNIIFISIFASLLFVLFAGFGHPFYLSVTELKYSQSSKSLQGSVKIFTNDLEDALRNLEKKPIDLINGKDTVANSEILETYLKKRLIFSINGEEKSYEFVGYEHEHEAVWIYIEINNCELPKKIKVTNSILYDFIKAQSNIIHVQVNADSKSSKVSYPDTDLSFDL